MKDHFRKIKRIMMYIAVTWGICFVGVPASMFFFTYSYGAAVAVLTAFMCLMMLFVSFTEINRIACKEARYRQTQKPYLFKGFVLGLMAELPMWLLSLVVLLGKDRWFADFFSHIGEKYVDYVANIFTIPFVWIIAPMNFKIYAYIIAFLILPIVCGIGYILGLKGIDIEDKVGGVRKN